MDAELHSAGEGKAQDICPYFPSTNKTKGGDLCFMLTLTLLEGECLKRPGSIPVYRSWLPPVSNIQEGCERQGREGEEMDTALTYRSS